MSAGRSASFCLLFCHFLLRSSEALENITAVVGQEVTLTCKAVNNNNITVVEWSRPELEQEEYVLFYRDGKLISHYQLPSYVNRVDLQDKEMKNGDVSLILKDVKMEDRGTYECRVFHEETNRRKRSTDDPISIIYLDVGPPGHKDGGHKDGGHKDGGHKDGGGKAGIILGVVGLILLAVASVGFLVGIRYYKKKSKRLPAPTDEATDEQMLYM